MDSVGSLLAALSVSFGAGAEVTSVMAEPECFQGGEVVPASSPVVGSAATLMTGLADSGELVVSATVPMAGVIVAAEAMAMFLRVEN